MKLTSAARSWGTCFGCALLAGLASCSGELGPPQPADVPSDVTSNLGGATGNEPSSSGSAPAVSSPPGAQECTANLPGEAPLRRLSRVEYTFTVSDLLGVDVSDLGTLTPDERIGAFRSNLTVGLSTLGVEQYADMASEIASRVQGFESLAGCDLEADGQNECAKRLIGTIGRRAYRRPLTSKERGRYEELFEEHAEDFESGARLILTALLQSPNFLYRVESFPSKSSDEGVPLDEYELATRLSYFLWKTSPDDALLDAAESGALHDRFELRSQVFRMLEDPRVERTLSSFAVQWLGLEKLGALNRELEQGVLLSDEVQLAMRQETVDFVNEVVRDGDASLQTLLQGPQLSDDPLLLPFYGDAALAQEGSGMGGSSAGDAWSEQRAGLLTQLSFLTSHAHSNQTSPIQRGLFVRTRLLCTDLPDPPADVNNTPPQLNDEMTTRERFLEHASSTGCKGCHELIDPLGFGFEKYDEVGRFRSQENGQPIDDTVEVVQAGSDDGIYEGAVELSHQLAQSELVHRCFSKQWFRYAMGRRESRPEECTMTEIEEEFLETDGDVRELLLSIATSESFRLHQGDQE